MEAHAVDVIADDRTLDPDDRVDEEILAELLVVLGDAAPNGLVEAYDLFMAAGPERLLAIDSALASGRLEDAARAAHSLRGSAGAFGARRLSTLATHVEHLCAGNDAGSAAALVAEMQAEFVAFGAILGARLTARIPQG